MFYNITETCTNIYFEKAIILSKQIGKLWGIDMKKIALILGIVFLILAFAGGIYVIINHGQVNAGYAVVPGLWTMICFGYYRSKKHE